MAIAAGLGAGYTVSIIIAVLAAIALTVLLCIKVIPEKKDGTFAKPIMQQAHDYFNFKKLYVESILKVLFAFASFVTFLSGLLVAVLGNFILFISAFMRYIDYPRYFSWGSVFGSMFLLFIGGIAFAVIAPIILRLFYEIVMMFVLLVKNTIDINNKIKKQD